jgi:hypothetical protein
VRRVPERLAVKEIAHGPRRQGALDNVPRCGNRLVKRLGVLD